MPHTSAHPGRARIRLLWIRWLAVAVLAVPCGLSGATPDRILDLWTESPPGATRAGGPERRVTGRPRPFYQLTGIDHPTLHVFDAPAGLRNGTAVLVCPGGGLQRLAWEHEGLEVAEWLNAAGITAAVLKYRVPSPARTAAMGAQRAIGLIRHHAADWGIDPRAVGVLGFSAGGEIAAWLLTHASERLHPVRDAADREPTLPDFAALIYPGGLVNPTGTGLREPVASGIRPGMPPVFLVHAFDDSAENSIELARVFKRLRIPVELHLYASGGHGFGVRPSGIPTGLWTDRFVDWLRPMGFLDPAPLRAWADATASSIDRRVPPDRLTVGMPGATLADAYAAQRRLARIRFGADPMDAFKGAAASRAAQESLGLDGPIAAPLFRSNRVAADPPPTVLLRPDEPVVVETEIAYILGADIPVEIRTDAQARDAVQAMVAVIELPRNLTPGQPSNARDAVASLIGSDRYIVGTPVAPEELDPDAIRVVLRRDGATLHEAAGSDAAGGQWHNLRRILNTLTRHGYTLPAGTLVLGGALGKIHPATPARYQADFGPLGMIRFELQPFPTP